MGIQRYTDGKGEHGEPTPAQGRWMLIADHERLVADLRAQLAEARERVKDLESGLESAAMSLETIDEQAGRDEFMKHWDQVRGYAHSRSNAARAALSPASGCEYCGPVCHGGAAHNARVEDGVKYSPASGERHDG